jgi:hypothetical protein
MEGLTIAEMAERSGLTAATVKTRLYRAGIKPIAYAGPTAFYAEAAYEAVKGERSMGRPKKADPKAGKE